ncbi:AAA family ATPase [Microvirga sp. HBU67558]|uniref:AAA family ATPase n=1 Tax=Microvirga TaxID=186650 RepID=UPI001B38959B|nr:MULTISPECIES: AAA family ATPase [unclassified Microvirga]MBQ0819479.1 AAA family ATPase [Microvirga sp. HBU67558]
MLNPNLYTVEHFPPLDEPFPIKPDCNGKSGRPKLRIRSARELRRREFSPIRYVVPDYIAEGCTLLAGRPKLGKSWLVLEMGLAVAMGEVCLGRIKCEHGDVLYLALEDNERRLRKRIDKVLGPLNEWPEGFQYATEWPRANEGGLDAIRDWITSAQNPRLIIVDVLAMFKPARGDRENMYEADYHAIKGLQALASEFGVAIIVVHHTRKGGSDTDPFEKVSGTLGLSGAADTTIVLDRDSNGATLYGRGRDIEEIESAVEFNKGDCRWFVMGDVSEVRRSDERTTILDILSEAAQPLSPREVTDLSGLSYDNVRQLLTRMSAAGEITKVGRAQYRHNDAPVTTVTSVTKSDDSRDTPGGE